MLYEVGRSFMPQPEERLLAVVYALLHRCYKHPSPTGGEVPSSLKKELSGVCRACFSPETVAKHPDFVAAHRARFEHDLDPDASTFPQTMATLTDALRNWRALLASAVDERYPGALRLEVAHENTRARAAYARAGFRAETRDLMTLRVET